MGEDPGKYEVVIYTGPYANVHLSTLYIVAGVAGISIQF